MHLCVHTLVSLSCSMFRIQYVAATKFSGVLKIDVVKLS